MIIASVDAIFRDMHLNRVSSDLQVTYMSCLVSHFIGDPTNIKDEGYGLEMFGKLRYPNIK